MIAYSVVAANSQNTVDIQEAKVDTLESPSTELNATPSESRGEDLVPKAFLERHPIVKDYKLYIKSFGLLNTLVSIIFILLKSGVDKSSRELMTLLSVTLNVDTIR